MSDRFTPSAMRIPLLILAALLAAAVAVGLGGVRMSRRQWQERIPADRTALSKFAEQWQNELARLKEVYEQDLEEIAYLSRLDRPWGLMQECRNRLWNTRRRSDRASFLTSRRTGWTG